ncbi:hypothetical protein [Elioraea sp.]|uniref:hypothetical protein n=1 Tax=Elioraea sp. TaxID=2185103 RepID=UPI0025C41E49|nr:hypothetical protein [Elioraea sp.]
MLAAMLCLSFPTHADAQRGLGYGDQAQRAEAPREPTEARVVAANRTIPSDRGGQARACLVAAAEAEVRLGLPRGLLAALALTESAAHPFAVGTPQRSHYASSREEAMRIAARAGEGASAGCFQINVGVHAPEDPAWVLDPWQAALFAGRKLARLASAGDQDWGAAVIRYAGARPGTEAASLQRCRVAGSLAGIGQVPPPGLGTAGCRAGELRVAQAKARTISARANGPEAVAALP